MPTQPWTQKLSCVRCYSPTNLMRITPAEKAIRLLTYECSVCGHLSVVRAEPPMIRRVVAA
jgi:DNA-directed RNA polymerase subunit RPC12/RpoP